MMEARMSAAALAHELKGRKVIFVGLQVAEAFDAISPRFFEWRKYPTFGEPSFQGCAIPHPSGINRFWNEPGNQKTARRFFDQLLGRA